QGLPLPIDPDLQAHDHPIGDRERGDMRPCHQEKPSAPVRVPGVLPYRISEDRRAGILIKAEKTGSRWRSLHRQWRVLDEVEPGNARLGKPGLLHQIVIEWAGDVISLIEDASFAFGKLVGIAGAR